MKTKNNLVNINYQDGDDLYSLIRDNTTPNTSTDLIIKSKEDLSHTVLDDFQAYDSYHRKTWFIFALLVHIAAISLYLFLHNFILGRWTEPIYIITFCSLSSLCLIAGLVFLLLRKKNNKHLIGQLYARRIGTVTFVSSSGSLTVKRHKISGAFNRKQYAGDKIIFIASVAFLIFGTICLCSTIHNLKSGNLSGWNLVILIFTALLALAKLTNGVVGVINYLRLKINHRLVKAVSHIHLFVVVVFIGVLLFGLISNSDWYEVRLWFEPSISLFFDLLFTLGTLLFYNKVSKKM